MSQQYANSADRVLNNIETLAKRQFLPIIGAAKGKYLVEEIRKSKPKHVVEVGTLIGYSAILMAKELDANAELVTVEIHRDEAEVAAQNVEQAHLAAKITIIVGDAIEVLHTLKGPFDFAFVDAEKVEYRQYLDLIEDRLSKGAVVFADNAGIFANEMGDYLDYVRNSGKYSSHYIQVGDDGVEISVKK